MRLHCPAHIKKKSSVLLLFSAFVIYMKLLLLTKGWEQQQPSTCYRANQGMCPHQPVMFCHFTDSDKQKAQGRAGAAPRVGRTCSSSWANCSWLLAPWASPKTVHKVFLFLGRAEFGNKVLSNDDLVMKCTLVKLNYVMRVSVAAWL